MASTVLRRCEVLLLVTFVVSPLFSAFSSEYPNIIFKTEPTNRIVKEGDYVNFTCVVNNCDPLTNSIIWNVSPDLGNYETSVRFDKESKCMTSTLTMHAMRNLQLFSCDVYSKTQLCLSSRMASMKVEYFPSEEDLSCGPSGPQHLQVGDVMHTYCEVPRGNPGVDMSWRFLPVLLSPSLPLARDESARRILSFDFAISHEMHMRKIICDVTSEIAFPGRMLQCSIGPLLVLQTPNVLIRPDHVVVESGKSADLICIADGYPHTFNFSWSCIPANAVEGCDSKSDTARISVNKYFHQDAQSFVLITCTASNSQGISRYYLNASIVLQHQNLTRIPDLDLCADEIEPTVSVTFQNKTDVDTNNEGKTVLCEITNVTNKHDIHIKLMLQIEESRVMDIHYQNLSSLMSQLNFQNMSIECYKRLIHCLVTVCNKTYIDFMALLESSGTKYTSDGSGLSTAFQPVSTKPLLILDVVQDGLNTSSGDSSSDSLGPMDYLYYSVSSQDDTGQSTEFLRASSAKPFAEWPVITVSLSVVIAVVVIVSGIVVLISVFMYKYLKRENTRSMNNFISELSTNRPVCMSDSKHDEDHLYEDPQLMLKSKCPPIIKLNSQWSCKLSDDCSIGASISPTSSWSNSSGIYLEPNCDDNTPEGPLNQREASVHNLYENERVMHPAIEQRSMLSYRTKDVNIYPHTTCIMDIPMPAYPTKIAKE